MWSLGKRHPTLPLKMQYDIRPGLRNRLTCLKDRNALLALVRNQILEEKGEALHSFLSLLFLTHKNVGWSHVEGPLVLAWGRGSNVAKYINHSLKDSPYFFFREVSYL